MKFWFRFSFGFVLTLGLLVTVTSGAYASKCKGPQASNGYVKTKTDLLDGYKISSGESLKVKKSLAKVKLKQGKTVIYVQSLKQIYDDGSDTYRFSLKAYYGCNKSVGKRVLITVTTKNHYYGNVTIDSKLQKSTRITDSTKEQSAFHIEDNFVTTTKTGSSDDGNYLGYFEEVAAADLKKGSSYSYYMPEFETSESDGDYEVEHVKQFELNDKGNLLILGDLRHLIYTKKSTQKLVGVADKSTTISFGFNSQNASSIAWQDRKGQHNVDIKALPDVTDAKSKNCLADDKESLKRSVSGAYINVAAIDNSYVVVKKPSEEPTVCNLTNGQVTEAPVACVKGFKSHSIDVVTSQIAYSCEGTNSVEYYVWNYQTNAISAPVISSDVSICNGAVLSSDGLKLVWTERSTNQTSRSCSVVSATSDGNGNDKRTLMADVGETVTFENLTADLVQWTYYDATQKQYKTVEAAF